MKFIKILGFFCVMIMVIVIFVLNMKDIRNIKLLLEDNLEKVNSQKTYINLQLNLRSMINIANGLENQEFDD